MCDLLMLQRVDEGSETSIDRDLRARAAGAARSLADFVESSATESPVADSVVAFLREWAAGEGMPLGSTPDPATPLGRLHTRLALSDTEISLLLLAGLTHEHEGLAATLRSIHPRGLPHVSVGVAAHLVSSDVDRADLWHVLHEGPARRLGLLDIEKDQPFFERCLLLPEGVWPALHGIGQPALDMIPVPAVPAGLDGWLELPQIRRAVSALSDDADCAVLLSCSHHEVGLGRMSALSWASGRPVIAAAVRGDDRAALHQLRIQAIAMGAIPAVVAAGGIGEGQNRDLQWPDGAGSVIVITSPGAIEPPASLALVTVPLWPLPRGDYVAAWRDLDPGQPWLAESLATRHPLDPMLAQQVGRDVNVARAAHDGPVVLDEVSASIRSRATSALPSGVTLVAPTAQWSRLVVDVDAEQQLRDAVARWDRQSVVLDDWGMAFHARASRGVRVLLTGVPGTGKSLAAEVLAQALGTDLLVVDISQVVSKWIGETEKNLDRIFDVAERSQAVLMLDEADALFGTRTEIGDAHDRYANLETAYLLQRLDRFDGLVVLASNLKGNIDPAFLRRIDVTVELGLPDANSRRRLWELHLPAHVRAPGVHMEDLAVRFAIPGGWIRNASIGAAFLAASGAGLVEPHHVVSALRREYAKAGKPFPALSADSSACDLRAVQAIEAAVGAAHMSEETR